MSGDWGFGLVLARCAGFFFRAPGFSHPAVPPPVRAGLAYVLALAIARPSLHLVAPPGGLIAGLIGEALLGAAIGTAASALYDGAYAGGRMVDDYVGIRVSMPSVGTVAPSGFGRLWSQAFTTGYFVLGGYQVALSAFIATFATLPPGGLIDAGGLTRFAAALPTTLVRAALLVAAPAIAIAFLAQAALAMISRVVSSLSVSSSAFALVFGAVLLVTGAAIPALLPVSARPWLTPPPLRAR